MPMLGVIRLTFDEEDESMSGEEDFFSVARTIPFVAKECIRSVREVWILYVPLIPREVTPWLTALRAYSGSMLIAVARWNPVL